VGVGGVGRGPSDFDGVCVARSSWRISLMASRNETGNGAIAEARPRDGERNLRLAIIRRVYDECGGAHIIVPSVNRRYVTSVATPRRARREKSIHLNVPRRARVRGAAHLNGAKLRARSTNAALTTRVHGERERERERGGEGRGGE